MSLLKLRAYSDVDWTDDVVDGQNHGGRLAFYGGGPNILEFKKQLMVAHSSTEVEFRSLVDMTP